MTTPRATFVPAPPEADVDCGVAETAGSVSAVDLDTANLVVADSVDLRDALRVPVVAALDLAFASGFEAGKMHGRDLGAGENARLREALRDVLPYVNVVHFSGPELVRASAVAEAARAVLGEP